MTTFDTSDALIRYQQLVARLTDRDAVANGELDELAPGTDQLDALWVPVLVDSRVVPQV